MFNFFVNETDKHGDRYYIIGSDFNHIANVLRMKQGEVLLVSCGGKSDLCEIEEFETNCVVARITQENFQDTSLPIKMHLLQGLPKSDKMELIIQKAVELGVEEITPIEMSRCVVKLDDKKKKNKTARWQSIAESAAKQSKRTIIPEVHDAITINQLKNRCSDFDILLVPYERKNGMQDTKTALEKIKGGMTVGILIGPEGGFDESEIRSVTDMGAHVISLGKRILRTETAAITALSMCMLYAEMNLGE